MKKLMLAVLIVFSAASLYAQKSAVKYDSDGRVTGLVNLHGDAAGCGSARIFAGTISKWSMDIEGASEETLNEYFFTVVMTRTKKRSFYFGFGDDLKESEVRAIIRKNGRVTVWAAPCKGGVWQVSEVSLGNKL